MNKATILISLHAIIATLISTAFFLTLLDYKDELEQESINNALKKSVVITFISLLGYSFYMLIIGNRTINISALFFTIEGLGILTIFFYYLELKGIYLSINIKSEKVTNILLNISTTISILAAISLFLKPKYFANSRGFIRYDELILYINVILTGIIISMVPNIRKKFSREEYKERQRKLDKIFKFIFIVYGMFMLLLIIYIFYQKNTK